MAYINIDIEDYLDEVDIDLLIGAVAEKYAGSKPSDQAEILNKLRKDLKFEATAASVRSESIEEQSKRDLIEEFWGKLSYSDLEAFINSTFKFKN